MPLWRKYARFGSVTMDNIESKEKVPLIQAKSQEIIGSTNRGWSLATKSETCENKRGHKSTRGATMDGQEMLLRSSIGGYMIGVWIWMSKV